MFCYSYILYFRTFVIMVVGEVTSDIYSAVIGGMFEVPKAHKLNIKNSVSAHAV